MSQFAGDHRGSRPAKPSSCRPSAAPRVGRDPQCPPGDLSDSVSRQRDRTNGECASDRPPPRRPSDTVNPLDISGMTCDRRSRRRAPTVLGCVWCRRATAISPRRHRAARSPSRRGVWPRQALSAHARRWDALTSCRRCARRATRGGPATTRRDVVGTPRGGIRGGSRVLAGSRPNRSARRRPG